MPIPNFFVVGAPKAGTTALYAFLDQHPQVFMCPLKEPNYFADELRLENFALDEQPRLARETRALEDYLRGDLRAKRFGGLVSSWEDYVSLFRNASTEIALGEASACYLWSPSAPGNIAARIPEARIIINLRNPIERAFSQYTQMVTVGRIRRSFREQLRMNLQAGEHRFGMQWPLLEFGCYHAQIERYLRAFHRSRLHISLYEDLERDPASLLADLFHFLGVDPEFVVNVSDRHHQSSVPRVTTTAYYLKKWGWWPHLRRLLPRPLGPRLRSLLVHSRSSLAMAPEDRRFLADFYRQDVERLSQLLDRDLTPWLAS